MKVAKSIVFGGFESTLNVDLNVDSRGCQLILQGPDPKNALYEHIRIIHKIP
jgi:hypothetical protein